jgi:hypothetical protein
VAAYDAEEARQAASKDASPKAPKSKP